MLAQSPEHSAARQGSPVLPIPLTALIGRDAEVALARAHLLRQDVRLLTLTGTAGVGKTRLALTVGAMALDFMADGAVFVDLAPITDSALVLTKVGEAVGAPPAAGEPLIAQLSRVLRDSQRLLVIDNCEHVLAAGAEIAALLAACAPLKVLATSRAPLRLSGEQELPVSPLADESAVRLFVDRAHRVRPDLALDDGDLEVVGHICRRLDGLPLAIELAAARCRVLDPSVLLARLDRRLPLLTGGGRARPARHRTLRAAIAWSHDLLNDAERTLFRQLAVFAGGFTLEAAESICGQDGLEVLNGLEALVEWSLVGRVAPRFRMLETIREFAVEQLVGAGEANDIRERHAIRCVEVAERAAAELGGYREQEWRERLAGEEDDATAALAWTMAAGHAELGMRLAGALRHFWLASGRLSEGRRWLEQLLALSGPTQELTRAKALGAAGALAVWQDDRAGAQTLLDEGLATARRAGDKSVTADVLSDLELLATRAHDDGASLALAEEALALRRELAEPSAIALALSTLGRAAASAGDAARSRVLYEESLAIGRRLGDRFGVATVLSYMGRDALRRNELQAARELCQEALAIFRELGVQAQIAWALLLLGAAARRGGDIAAAEGVYREALGLVADMAIPLWVAVALAGLGGVALDAGHAERAGRLLSAAEGLRAAVGVYPQIWDTPAYERDLSAVESVLGRRAASVFEAGRGMRLEDLVQLGLGAPTAIDRSRRGAGPLTAREREIAAHVAQGLSNRQLAAQLFISDRTAGNHVEHILHKLGLRTRAQIAAWVVAQQVEGAKTSPN